MTWFHQNMRNFSSVSFTWSSNIHNQFFSHLHKNGASCIGAAPYHITIYQHTQLESQTMLYKEYE